MASAIYPRIPSSIHPVNENKNRDPSPVLPRAYHFGAANPGNNILWTVGDQGRILRSSDGGENWDRQPTSTDRNLMDIAAWNPQRAVVVGNKSVVLRTENGGNSWRTVTDIPKSKISNKLYRVRIAPDGSAWVVGERSTILRSDDGGKTWRRMAEEGRTSWYGIAFPSNTPDAVVSDFRKHICRRLNGETWSWHSESPPLEQSLKSVDFRDPSLGVAVGLNGRVLRTSDGGRTWELQESGTRNHLFTVSWSTNRWVALGAW